MKEFWNDRYASGEYAYGIEPNQFFKDQIEKLKPGKILFPAEGEGRNAVYAATLGFDVIAFDPSIEGKNKAELLAGQHQVKIEYITETYENILLADNFFDVIVLIFAHIPSSMRKNYHQKLIKSLKPDGILILEGFSKEQIENNTGGPKDITMLFSEDELRDDFNSLRDVEFKKTDVDLNEGPYHQGIASVIQLVGKK